MDGIKPVLSKRVADRVLGNVKDWWAAAGLAYLIANVIATVFILTSLSQYSYLFPSLMWLLVFVSGGIAIKIEEFKAQRLEKEQKV